VFRPTALVTRRDHAGRFNRGPDTGHGVLACHLPANAGMLATARREQRPAKAARYFLLLGSALD
jgi:hypothetical protein